MPRKGNSAWSRQKCHQVLSAQSFVKNIYKAKRKIYRHSDMAHLKEILENDEDVKNARRKMLVTDGVFSMDGDIANLPEIVELCKKHNVILRDTFIDEFSKIINK